MSVAGSKKAEMRLNSTANPASNIDQCLVTKPQSDPKKFFCLLPNLEPEPAILQWKETETLG